MIRGGGDFGFYYMNVRNFVFFILCYIDVTNFMIFVFCYILHFKETSSVESATSQYIKSLFRSPSVGISNFLTLSKFSLRVH